MSLGVHAEKRLRRADTNTQPLGASRRGWAIGGRGGGRTTNLPLSLKEAKSRLQKKLQPDGSLLIQPLIILLFILLDTVKRFLLAMFSLTRSKIPCCNDKTHWALINQ